LKHSQEGEAHPPCDADFRPRTAPRQLRTIAQRRCSIAGPGPDRALRLSRNKRPVGPPSGRVVSQVAVAAPCSIRPHRGRSAHVGRTQPGQMRGFASTCSARLLKLDTRACPCPSVAQTPRQIHDAPVLPALHERYKPRALRPMPRVRPVTTATLGGAIYTLLRSFGSNSPQGYIHVCSRQSRSRARLIILPAVRPSSGPPRKTHRQGNPPCVW
jgi:hypothetical protein